MSKKLLKQVSIVCLVFSSSLVMAQDPAKTTSSTFPAPTPIETQEEYRVHMGVNLGFNTPEGSYDTTSGLGVEVGYQPYIPFGVGAELFTTQIDADKGNDEQRTTLLGRGSYNFGGTAPVIRNSFVGLGAGPVYADGVWEVGLAPLVGFDIPVTKINDQDLTLGANAKFLVTSTNSPDSFMANLAVKYWY
jgi:hypothetical protein